MNTKIKYYVFDRKEVFLIFLLVFFLALVSFCLGVRLGNNFAYQRAELTLEDQKQIELKSVVEEQVESISEEKEKADEKENEAHLDKTYLQLKKEFSVLNEQIRQRHNSKAGDSSISPNAYQAVIPSTSSQVKAPSQKERGLSSEGNSEKTAAQNSLKESEGETKGHKNQVIAKGKYTIQLGSYQNESDARKFSDGFSVRGYEPLITEVKIENRGIWYRVSLGIFNSLQETKSYIDKEDSLFQGQDYVIIEVN